MAEFGAAIIRFAFSVLAGLLFFFGIDDKDPLCLILGVALLCGVLIMTAM